MAIVTPQLALFFVLFVDLFSVAVVLPLIPQYAKELKIEASLYGLLGSLYGLAQLLGAPVMGSISDSYGRNVVLAISCVGTCIAYLVMGFTNSVVLFFLLRLPVGYVRQTVTAASAYISDSTSVDQRTVALGWVQMIMSASFLVGPIVSGISAQRDPTLKLPIYIATAGFVIEFLALMYVLPDSRTLSPVFAGAGSADPSKKSAIPVPAGHPSIKAGPDGKLPVPCPFSMDAANGGSTGNGSGQPAVKQTAAESMTSFWSKLRANLTTLLQYIRDPVMATLLLTFFVFTFTLTAYRESLVLSLQSRFDLAGGHVSYVWAYVAFLGMVVQGVAIAPLTKRWSESQLTGVCLLGLAVSHIGTGLAPTFKVWIAVMPFVALFGGVLRTCVVGMLSKNVARAQVGAMLGLTDFLTSICRVICPFFGGVLLQYTGANSTDYVVSLLSVAMALYLKWDHANNQPITSTGNGSTTGTANGTTDNNTSSSSSDNGHTKSA